jgi:hypothetical protein
MKIIWAGRNLSGIIKNSLEETESLSLIVFNKASQDLR